MSLKTKKAERTRESVMQATLALVNEKGYDAVTMRQIAKQAGLSIGAAYYYFPTKEHIIHAFYEHTQAKMLEVVSSGLENAVTLEDAVHMVVHAQIKHAVPYHAFSRALFKAAVDPNDPLSPLSENTETLRRAVIDLYGQCIQRFEPSAADGYRGTLPVFLWLFHMGIVTYWVFDTSQNFEKTFKLLDRAAPLVCRAVRIGKVPGVGALTSGVVELLLGFRIFREVLEQDEDKSSI